MSLLITAFPASLSKHIPPSHSSLDRGNLRSALLTLAEIFPVFPSPSGCQNHGRKLQFVQTLDAISKKMETSRPATMPWDPCSQPPPFGYVLKRDFSDAARHVYVPKYPLGTGQKATAAELRRATEFVQNTTDHDQPISGSWLAQEYVPTLSSVGELRFICIDGNPVRVVITGKHKPGHPDAGQAWTIEGIKTMLSLHEIRCAPPSCSLFPSSLCWIFRSLVKREQVIDEPVVFGCNQSVDDAKKALGDLEQFVKHFLKHLKARDGPNSSLQVFCRVDVGILARAPDTASYFINEVERGITTSLWVTDGPYTAGMSGMSIVASLKRWVAAEKHRLRENSY